MTGFVQHLLRTRSVHLLWNFIEEIILKGYFKLWDCEESDLYDGIDVSGYLPASYKVPLMIYPCESEFLALRMN